MTYKDVTEDGIEQGTSVKPVEAQFKTDPASSTQPICARERVSQSKDRKQNNSSIEKFIEIVFFISDSTLNSLEKLRNHDYTM
jgi:hypothetical protein